jgi:hypothetical protein
MRARNTLNSLLNRVFSFATETELTKKFILRNEKTTSGHLQQVAFYPLPIQQVKAYIIPDTRHCTRGLTGSPRRVVT